MSFRWALTNVLHHEGGLVDHPDDPGGITNFGVSLRFLRASGIDVDGDGDIDAEDIRNLHRPDAAEIYREWFWKPAKCDEIRSELIHVKVFDMAVNMGQKQAYKLVQRALNRLGKSLTVDGIVGPNTLGAINSMTDEDFNLVEEIRHEQADFYLRLIDQKPRLAAFRKGWLRRAAS